MALTKTTAPAAGSKPSPQVPDDLAALLAAYQAKKAIR